MTALSADQLTGISRLGRLKVGALFMKPGTGKTRTAMELVHSVPNVDLVLWLAPFRSVHPKIEGTGIADELHKWSGLQMEHILCGIETLSSSDRTFLDLLGRIKAAKNPFIVVDESLKIKNWNSKRTRRICELGKLAQYKLVLNGTPISRNLLDLWAQFEFLSPRILKMSLQQYKNTFVEYTTVRKWVGSRTIVKETIDRYHNVEHLYNLIGPYVYEADLKLEVSKILRTVCYGVDQDARDEYARLKREFLDDERLMAKNNNIFLEMTQKMQHTYSTTADKFTKLDALLEKHDPAKTIIFCKYVDSRKACAERYPGVAVLSLQSDTMALNLQDRNVSVIFDKTWDYALIDQLVYRTYRTGQQLDCIYYHFTGDLPLEALMDRNVENKMSMLEYFNSRSIKQLEQEL